MGKRKAEMLTVVDLDWATVIVTAARAYGENYRALVLGHVARQNTKPLPNVTPPRKRHARVLIEQPRAISCDVVQFTNRLDTTHHLAVFYQRASVPTPADFAYPHRYGTLGRRLRYVLLVPSCSFCVLVYTLLSSACRIRS